MAPPISIDPKTGSICLGDSVRLSANDPKAAIEHKIAEWLHGSRNHGNGYEWLDLRGFSFGGHPAALSLCFHDDCLVQAAWGVQLPNAPSEGGWPTRKAIDDEVKFVRTTLTNMIEFKDGFGRSQFPWGEVWSDFDNKGFLASNGLRYRRS
ncbi:MAG: hypothetical protein P0Y52_13355 [Candidatus Brevundimonas phytovorans]|nr:hypothetical protein [Brevundimonas sp.]WEK57512.1 MAG: hypothetical protein P0Y52_13355 [Brevundimonas sp.]